MEVAKLKENRPRAVLALCLGNICRSPIAEELLREHCSVKGLELIIDSAGTSAYHSGEAPDRRSVKVMSQHGHDISEQRSRPLSQLDFKRFDLILAMDQTNLKNARQLCKDKEDESKVQLFLRDGRDVPDPYYGGVNGFERVYQMIERSAIEWAAIWAQLEVGN